MTGPAAVTRSTVPAAHSQDRQGDERNWWPLNQHLELGAVLTAPGCGRGWIQAVLQEWGLASAIDLAQLLVSELLTNAVAASARCGATVVHLGLASDRERLLITVRDFALGAPAPRNPSADDDSGRGLQIVSELAEEYGWHPPRDGGPGKVVWASTTGGNLSRNEPHLTAPGEAMSNQTLTQHPCPAATADRGRPPGPAGSRARAIAWPACPGLVPPLADRRVTRETGHG